MVGSQWLPRLLGAPAPVEGQLWQHRLPLLQRKDGSLLKPGLLVRRGDKIFLVSDILVCGKSLEKLTVLLRPVVNSNPSPGMLTISKANIEVGEGEVVVEPGDQISHSVARAALARVAEEASRQPMLVRRLARKHQLAYGLRKAVKKVLRCRALSFTLCLGSVDLSHDPSILGIGPDTGWGLEYRLEERTNPNSSPLLLDSLLGVRWDLAALPLSHRLVTSLTLRVTLKHEMLVKVEAVTLEGPPTSNYRTACLESRPELLTTELAKEVQEESPGEVRMTDGEGKAGAEAEEVNQEVDITTSSDDGDSHGGANLHHVLDRECEDTKSCDQNSEEGKHSDGDIQEDYNNHNQEEGLKSPININNDSTKTRRCDKRESFENTGVNNFEKTQDTSEGTLEKTIEDDSCNNTNSSSYMIVILPPGPAQSVDTTQESSLVSQSHPSSEAEEEDQISADLGYPKTDTPSMNTASPNASPLRGAISGDLPDADDRLLEYEAGREEEAGSDYVNQRKIIGVSSEISSEESSIEHDEGIVGDEEVKKDGQGNIFSKVSRSFKTSTPLRPDESAPAKEKLFKVPHKLEKDLGQIKDEPRLNNRVGNPLSKVAAYLETLPPPSGREGNIIDKLSSQSSKDDDVEEEKTAEVLREGLLDQSFDSEAAVSQASGSKTSRQSDLGSLTGRFGAGAFYGASVLATAPTCPFPEEWQFNTIPESIENDEDID